MCGRVVQRFRNSRRSLGPAYSVAWETDQTSFYSYTRIHIFSTILSKTPQQHPSPSQYTSTLQAPASKQYYYPFRNQKLSLLTLPFRRSSSFSPVAICRAPVHPVVCSDIIFTTIRLPEFLIIKHQRTEGVSERNGSTVHVDLFQVQFQGTYRV